MACAFCHTPTGQGRPENSALAGLPEAYIKEQLHDFRSGKRTAIGPAEYLPSRDMQEVARAMTDEEIDESAKYFAQQKLRRRVYVVESLHIPRAERAAWVYKEVGGTEDLDERLLEVAQRTSRATSAATTGCEYMAYVPPGHRIGARQAARSTTGQRPGQERQDAGLRHLPPRQSQGHRQDSADRRPLAYLPAAADAGVPQWRRAAAKPRRR